VRRVLIAPVTVTPTKVLTPSHLKGLLWVDVMYRATSLTAETTYRYSNTAYNTTAQNLGYWEFLDRTLGDIDYSGYCEEELGELYVRYQAEARRVPFAALRPYLRAVEDTGWVHQASVRLLGLWAGYYRRLGLHDPGLTEVQPPPMGLEEMIGHLAARDLCLDNRSTLGPVYVDATRFGLPLRQIVTREGQPNYLTCALRELVPLAGDYDEIVLVHDRELTADYGLLQRVLRALGGNAVRVTVDRVPIDGVVRSSRHGGWQGHTLPALLAACEDAEPDVLRLGMRLYFIAVLGKGLGQSLRVDLLRQSMNRARRLLAADSPRLAAEFAEYMGRFRRDTMHVDPYRLTSALLRRHDKPPVRDLIEQVYC
jgi:hypothetical protein